MQKVLRRTHLAKNQARRRARIQQAREDTRDRAIYRQRTSDERASYGQQVREERRVRREIWEMGALSPHPNYFSAALSTPDGHANIPPGQISDSFGTIPMSRLHQPPRPKRDRIKDWFIRPGDRVCVVKGREGVKGRIGKVESIDKQSNTLIVEGVNLYDVFVPEEMRLETSTAVNTQEGPMNVSDVELVYPLPDPVTGIPRDVIIRTSALRKRNAYFDVYKNKEVWDRVLHPQSISIPWPAETEPEAQDTESDTLRITVEDTTFLPTLLRPPMPMGVIDELRNKFGKFRTRHDDEYIERKLAEDEAKDAQKAWSASLVPRGARNVARLGYGGVKKMGDEPKPAPTLDDADLEIIGKAMAAKRAVE